MAKLLVVDSDATTLGWLKGILERENHSVTTADRGNVVLDEIRHSRPDLVVLEVVLPDTDGLALLRRLRQDPTLRDLRVIVLSIKSQPDDIVAGLTAGADDYIPKRPGADVELISKIRVLLALPRTARGTAAVSGGKVFAFCSAKGGTGTTSVCINTAHAMTQLDQNAKVLVVDMVLPVGTVGTSIGFESDKTIARLSREVPGKIDPATVDKYVSPPTRWGFRVLLSTQHPQETTSLEVSQIVPLFETLRSMYDYVFADFGRNLSRVSLPVMQTADRVVLVLTADVNTVKLTQSTLEYFEAVGISRDQLILITNRTVGRVWISKEEIEQQLHLSLAATIPFESEHFTMAINSGIPFMAKFPDHSASLAFIDLARLLLQRTEK